MKQHINQIPAADEEIINLFWSKDERAIAEVDRKYRKYLFSVLYNILADILDCEECLNDTYISAWNAIPPARPNSLKAFLCTIARRTAINRYHSNRRKNVVPSEMTLSLSELEDFIANDNPFSDETDTIEFGKLLSEFIRSLSERKQFIFISRYYMAEPIAKIASELNLSRSMVNKELTAIRNLLKEKLKKEEYHI